MKYLILTLSFAAALFTFTACEPVDLNAQVDYYISFTDSDKLDELSFSFSGARAHQVTADGSEAFRTVYLDDKPITVNFNETVEPILLGSSDIEPGTIEAYDLFWSNLSASYRGEELTLDFNDLSTHKQDIEFTAEQKKTITFLIDLDGSFVEQTDGSFKFEPIIKVVE